MALSHFLCAVPKTLDALFSVASSSRFVNQPIGKLKPFSASSILPSIIIPQPHRRNCTAVSVPSTSEGQQLVRSPQLVALEYADLNLSDSFSEVDTYTHLHISNGRVVVCFCFFVNFFWGYVCVVMCSWMCLLLAAPP